MGLPPMMDCIIICHYLPIYACTSPAFPVRALYMLSPDWWPAEPLQERSIHFHPIGKRLEQGMWFGQ